MKIGKVTTHNWMNYKGTHVHDFRDKDIIGIIAEFVGDKDASNQAGKSTIVEACLYGLTGDSRAKKDTELIHYGEDVMWVELELVEGDATYTVKRGRDAKNKGILLLDWIDKVTEAQKEINALIGYDSKEFKMITYFEQGEISQFMKLDNAKKKAYIIKWFKSEHWQELEDAVKSDLSDERKKLDKVKAKIEGLEETFENDIDLDTEIEVLEDELKSKKKTLTTNNKKLTQLRKNFTVSEDDYAKARRTVKKYKDKIEDINETIKDNDKYSELKEKWDNKAKDINKKIEMGVSTAHEGVARCMQQHKVLIEKVNLAKKHKSGLCPILSEPCDRIKFSQKDIDSWTKQASGLKENEKTYREQIDLNMEEADYQSKAQRCEGKIRKGEFHGEIEDAKEMIADAKKTIAKWDETLPEKIANAEDNIEGLQMEISELQNSVTTLKEKIRAKEDNEKRVLKYKKELKLIAQGIDDLQYLVAMFGKNGIPSLEIENGFQDVEDEANFILQEMNPNMDMVMKPTTPTNTKEPNCLECGWMFPKGTKKHVCQSCGADRKFKVKDEMQFNITKDGKEYNYYMDSGGGITLIALAMRMALTQLKRRMDGAKLNVIFLDEPDSALDKRYLNKFVELVARTLTNKLGIEQIFWISHNKEIQESIPHMYKVISNGKRAKASWVS